MRSATRSARFSGQTWKSASSTRQAGVWHFPYLTVRGKRFSIAPQPISELGIGAHVLRTRETVVIVENVQAALAKYRSHLLGPEHPKSMVYVPLIAGDQVARNDPVGRHGSRATPSPIRTCACCRRWRAA